jgi:hypothetical protein
MWEVSTSKFVAPSVSVNDRLVGPTSKYWTYWLYARDMGLVSLVACHRQMFDFVHYFYGWWGERNLVGTHGSVSRLAEDWDKSPVSQEQWLCSTLLMTTWKVAIHGLCKICMVECHTRTDRRIQTTCWSGFPYSVYIDSNHRVSRIWVTGCLVTVNM